MLVEGNRWLREESDEEERVKVTVLTSIKQNNKKNNLFS